MAEATQESEQSWTDSPALRAALLKQNKLRGKLEILTGMLGYKSLEARQRQVQAFSDATTRAVAKKLLGEEIEPEGEDVGNTILGDVTHPTPVVIAGQQSSGLGPILAAGLGMLGPAGAVAGYFLNQAMAPQPTAIRPANTQQVQQIERREQLGVRLLRPEDLQSPFGVDKPAGND